VIAIFIDIFLWGALIQVMYTKRGFAEEAIEKAVPALRAPAPLFTLATMILILIIIFIISVYIPALIKILHKE